MVISVKLLTSVKVIEVAIACVKTSQVVVNASFPYQMFFVKNLVWELQLDSQENTRLARTCGRCTLFGTWSNKSRIDVFSVGARERRTSLTSKELPWSHIERLRVNDSTVYCLSRISGVSGNSLRDFPRILHYIKRI